MRMLINPLNMLRGRQIQTLIRLGHQVAHEHPHRLRRSQRLRNPFHQKVRNKTGKKRTRTNGNQVSGLNSLQRLRQRLGIRRIEHQFHNALAARGDISFPAHQRTIVHASGERHVGVGCRVDMTARGQDLGRQLDSLGKVPCNFD